MPIIGFVGTKDRLHKQFIQFDEDLKGLNKEASIHFYEGAKHAWLCKCFWRNSCL